MKFIETEDEPGVTYWTLWPDFTLKEVQEKEADRGQCRVGVDIQEQMPDRRDLRETPPGGPPRPVGLWELFPERPFRRPTTRER